MFPDWSRYKLVKNNSKVNLPQSSPSELKPVEIVVSECFSFEDAVRRFKSLVQKERIIGQWKDNQSYEKPSIKKRRKVREAQAQRYLNDLREKMIASGEWDKRKKQKEQERTARIAKRKGSANE